MAISHVRFPHSVFWSGSIDCRNRRTICFGCISLVISVFSARSRTIKQKTVLLASWTIIVSGGVGVGGDCCIVFFFSSQATWVCMQKGGNECGS